MRVGRCGNEFELMIEWGLRKLNKALDYSEEGNVISIAEYVEEFKNTHQEFMKEFQKLKALPAIELKNVVDYSSEDSRSVRIQLGPNEDEDRKDESSEYTYLDIVEEDDRVWANLITKYGYAGKIMRLNVDEDTLKEYLNLLYKYRPLFELYIRQMGEYAKPVCERTKVFDGARSSLTIVFNSPDDSLFKGLDSVEISGNVEQLNNPRVSFKLQIDLENGFQVISEDSENNCIKLGDKPIVIENWRNTVINGILINGRHLMNNPIYEFEENESTIVLTK